MGILLATTEVSAVVELCILYVCVCVCVCVYVCVWHVWCQVTVGYIHQATRWVSVVSGSMVILPYLDKGNGIR